MGLVFHVGDQSMIPPVPKNFPRCGHWTPDLDPNFKSNLLQYLKEQNEEKVTINLDLLPTSDDKHPGPSYATPTQTNEQQQHELSSNSLPENQSFSSQETVVFSSWLIALAFVLSILI